MHGFNQMGAMRGGAEGRRKKNSQKTHKITNKTNHQSSTSSPRFFHVLQVGRFHPLISLQKERFMYNKEFMSKKG